MSREIEEWEYEIRNETPILPSNRGNKQEYLNMMGEEGWQRLCYIQTSPKGFILNNLVDMNREIKFRFWEEKSKTMIDWLCVRQTAFNRGDIHMIYDMMGTNPDIIKMQFTGLKDKNGKEVYEGDIVKYWYSRDASGTDVSEFTETIQWNQEGDMYGFGFLAEMNPEIIGNIYEYPHLLQK